MKKLKPRGGARPGAGRHADPQNKAKVQLSCHLRKDTVAALRAAAGSRFVGDVLQWHLDRNPIPNRETYLAFLAAKPYEAAAVKPRTWTKKERKLIQAGIAAAFENGDQHRKVKQSKPVANSHRRGRK